MERFDESSLLDLYRSAVMAFPRTNKRQHAIDPIIMEELRWLPYLGMKTLFIKGSTRNENRHYQTSILFKGVDYTQNEVKITASDMQVYRFKKLDLEHTDVLLRCNCPDFKWRFSYYDHLDSSLYGRKPAPYQSLGVGVPANPMQLPGMCKHLMKTVRALDDAGIFR